ncbi:MAG: hypothetical protein EMLJLAPB_00693 [Candidatus Argoarchaeum ethanivorans]|uniref:Transposase n=1 Tax=Candidatus Argoarchaeum ethanivorans TaxID=2608793 RepID=A0A811TDZ3_9EURY|nr:MAG: hypothetical protein EMLJLAPB_00693 [Candidatus Argoarchaeum ethanivorans]
MNRRPKTCLTDEQKKIIQRAHVESFLGAKLLRHHISIKYGQNTPQNKIHKYLSELGLAKPKY